MKSALPFYHIILLQDFTQWKSHTTYTIQNRVRYFYFFLGFLAYTVVRKSCIKAKRDSLLKVCHTQERKQRRSNFLYSYRNTDFTSLFTYRCFIFLYTFYGEVQQRFGGTRKVKIHIAVISSEIIVNKHSAVSFYFLSSFLYSFFLLIYNRSRRVILLRSRFYVLS